MERNKTQHALRRRFLSPAFSQQALKEAEKLITLSAIKLVRGLSSNPATPRNMGEWATWFGFDFISDLGYGESFGMLDHHHPNHPEVGTRWVPEVLKSASRFLYYVGYLPFIDLIRPLIGSKIQDYIGGQEAADSLKYTELANSRLAKRMQLENQLQEEREEKGQDEEKGGRRDTFHYLLNSRDPVTGKKFSKEELQADSALIIAAGSDGVGLTLSACIFYLLKNPMTLQHLVTEIRSSFGSVEEIKNPMLNTLEYLHACIEETLRLNPPKASSLPREVLKGGLEIDGMFIPEGITLGSPIYVLHHDPKVFPEPWEFKPERWILSNSSTSPQEQEKLSAAKATSIPFLVGPLNCIGKNMSYIALKLALVHLLWGYDIRISGELTGGGSKKGVEGRRREGEYQMWDWILGFRDGPMIEVRARE